MLLPFERKTLNKILTKVTALPDAISTVKTAVDTLAANWTATRAGYLDNIRSYTATNNTANATGTLSQKQTYTNSTLIGATGATGGTTKNGTVMAKINTLLKPRALSRQTVLSASKTNSTTEVDIVNLSNILLHDLRITVSGYDDTYTSYVSVYLNGELVWTKSNDLGDYKYKISDDYTNSTTLNKGFLFITDDNSPYKRLLSSPVFLDSLRVTFRGSTATTRVSGTAKVFYEQL